MKDFNIDKFTIFSIVSDVGLATYRPKLNEEAKSSEYER